MIFFSRAARTLTDRVTTAGGEPQLEKATPVRRNKTITVAISGVSFGTVSDALDLDIEVSYMCLWEMRRVLCVEKFLASASALGCYSFLRRGRG